MKTKLLLLFSYTALLFLPKINLAQSPELGAIHTFAVFNGNGIIYNSGATIIIGDAGVDNGNILGFPPGKVLGHMHIKDAIASEVDTAMDTLNDRLTATTCDSSLDISLGNNQFLTPSVYCLNENSTLNGNIILDGLGNPNALFIIKVDGDFSTARHANVVLINMASIDNVFWQVNGAFELGDSAVFMGNVITQGNINLLQGASVFGRVLALHGAIFLNTNFISTGQSLGPLAIKIATIKGGNIDFRKRIDWVSETEERGDQYEIARSSDGEIFNPLNTITSKGLPGSYTFWDEHPLIGTNYYRLKLKDASGKFIYSPIIKIMTKAMITLTVSTYPNPFIDKVTVILSGTKGKNSKINIIDISGRNVVTLIATENRIDLNTTYFQPGTYFIKYEDENGSQIIKINKLR